MSPSLIFLILRARIGIVLVTFLATTATATAISLILPRYYKATSQLVLNYKGVDSVTGSPAMTQQQPGYLDTQVDIIRSPSTALRVVDDLQLVKSDRYQGAFVEDDGKGSLREGIANRLLRELKVETSRESSVLNVSFSDQDPEFAATVANAFARAYRERSTWLKMDPVQQASQYFGNRIRSLRDNLEQAQARLSAYQREKGVTSADQKLDVETARLNELSQQLVAAQALAIEARSRRQSARGNPADSPDVAQNPVIQSLKVEASRAAAKVAELSAQLGPNHPQYEAAQAEFEKIQNQLRREVATVFNSISGTARIQEQREAELRAEVAQQKSRVLEVNGMRNEMAVLQNDVDNAQKSLDATTQRFTETSMEGQSNQIDISILSEARPPTTPASPKIALNILLSAVLGGLLGAGLGMLAEFLDRRLRSSEDLVELFQAPVVTLSKGKHALAVARRVSNPAGKYLPAS